MSGAWECGGPGIPVNHHSNIGDEQLQPIQIRAALRNAIDETERLGGGPEYYEHLTELSELHHVLSDHRQFDDELLMIGALVKALPATA